MKIDNKDNPYWRGCGTTIGHGICCSRGWLCKGCRNAYKEWDSKPKYIFLVKDEDDYVIGAFSTRERAEEFIGSDHRCRIYMDIWEIDKGTSE